MGKEMLLESRVEADRIEYDCLTSRRRRRRRRRYRSYVTLAGLVIRQAGLSTVQISAVVDIVRCSQ